MGKPICGIADGRGVPWVWLRGGAACRADGPVAQFPGLARSREPSRPKLPAAVEFSSTCSAGAEFSDTCTRCCDCTAAMGLGADECTAAFCGP